MFSFNFVLPSQPLRPYFDRYWIMRSDPYTEHLVEFPPVLQHNIALMLNDTSSWKMGTPSQPNQIDSSFVMAGQQTEVVRVPFPLVCDNIGVQIKPTGIYGLWGIPAHKMTEHFFDVRDVLNRADATRLVEQLINESNDEKLFALLDKFMLGQLQKRRVNDRHLKKIVFAQQQLVFSNGNACISKLAAQLCCSTRTLERYFDDYLGLPPKEFAKLVRFNKTIYLLDKEKKSLKEVIDALSFTDYSHLHKDFRSIMGISPTQYLQQMTIIDEAFIRDDNFLL
ncbi:MAG: AraC family transcriptional regulator [Verrucomicrobia bacterium]|nr:AraC family transcriptional regulator [Cytophagales bacterium]